MPLDRRALEVAREGGLKLTVHTAEIDNDPETSDIIDFRPDRLGHAIVLGDEQRDRLLSLQPPIPIEVCPTSNILTLELDGYGQHPTVAAWISAE